MNTILDSDLDLKILAFQCAMHGKEEGGGGYIALFIRYISYWNIHYTLSELPRVVSLCDSSVNVVVNIFEVRDWCWRLYTWWWLIMLTNTVPVIVKTRALMVKMIVMMMMIMMMMLIQSIETVIVGGGQVTVTRGGSFVIKCQLDDYYEFCTFRWWVRLTKS